MGGKKHRKDLEFYAVDYKSEYTSFYAMKARCNNPNHTSYPEYGGRGIFVCDEWMVRFEGWQTFMRKMGPKPDPTYTIDRIDTNKGYYAENCRWATRSTQVSCRRAYTNTGYRGVYFDKNRKKPYIATVTGKHVGAFYTPEGAAKWYDIKSIELSGKNACLNFPDKLEYYLSQLEDPGG